MLEVSVYPADGYVVCRPVGDLDSFTVGPFREALADVDPSSNLLVDLSAVPFLDSTGLGALIGSVHRMREGGGRMAVCASKASVARLLRMTGFDRLVAMRRTFEDAVEALLESDRISSVPEEEEAGGLFEATDTDDTDGDRQPATA